MRCRPEFELGFTVCNSRLLPIRLSLLNALLNNYH